MASLLSVLSRRSVPVLRPSVLSTPSVSVLPAGGWVRMLCSSASEEAASPMGRRLTHHERTLFVSPEDIKRKPRRMEDHGYRFGVQESEVEERLPAVKAALTTRTASIPELRSFRRQEILRLWSPDDFDTGSSRVQVAMLSDRIQFLQAHIRRHNHDKHALRTISIAVNRRRKLLRYMMRNDYDNYRICIRDLNIRSPPLFYSKYPPRSHRKSHAVIKEKRSRLKNRKSRGYKGH